MSTTSKRSVLLVTRGVIRVKQSDQTSTGNGRRVRPLADGHCK